MGAVDTLQRANQSHDSNRIEFVKKRQCLHWLRWCEGATDKAHVRRRKDSIEREISCVIQHCFAANEYLKNGSICIYNLSIYRLLLFNNQELYSFNEFSVSFGALFIFGELQINYWLYICYRLIRRDSHSHLSILYSLILRQLLIIYMLQFHESKWIKHMENGLYTFYLHLHRR